MVAAVVGGVGPVPLRSLLAVAAMSRSLGLAPPPIMPLIADEIELVRGRLPKIDTRTDAVVVPVVLAEVGVVTG